MVKNNINKDENNKPKNKSKKWLFILMPLIIIGILALSVYFMVFKTGGLSKDVILTNIEGNVEIYKNGNWIGVNGNEVKLKLNDEIRTNGGSATVIFYDDIITLLKPNTQIQLVSLLKDNVKINQKSGTTWNKFINVLGMSNYEIETPNSVATIRGTEFKLATSQEFTQLLVAEGKVSFGDDRQTTIVNPFEKYENSLDKGLEKKELTKDDLIEILENKKIIKQIIENRRNTLIESNKIVLNIIKRSYDLTDNDIKEKLNELDNSDYDLNELAKQVPIEVKNLDALIIFTKQLQDINKEIRDLENQINLKDE